MTGVSRTVKFLISTLALFAFTLAASQEQPLEQPARVHKAEGKNEQSGAKGHEGKPSHQPPQLQTPAVATNLPAGIEKITTSARPSWEQKDEMKEEGWWAKLFADPVAFFTCLLFFATLALWWATRRLVVGAEKSSERQLRAYISSRPDFIHSFSPKTLATMRYTIENHGQTPAYSMRNSAVVDILPYPLPEEFKFPPLPESMGAPMTLHPKETIFGNVTAQRNFSAKEISDAANDSGYRIYCFGIVTYETFGSTHTTKFCRSIVGCPNLQSVGSGTTKPNLDLSYAITSRHNEAD